MSDRWDYVILCGTIVAGVCYFLLGYMRSVLYLFPAGLAFFSAGLYAWALSQEARE